MKPIIAQFRFKRNFTCLFIVLIGVCSCSNVNKKDNPYILNLKWNKSHDTDSINTHIIGLKWALSFLGSNIALDTSYAGLNYTKDIIQLDITKLRFSKSVIPTLKNLNIAIKNSEEYTSKKHIDIGRYIALTIGNPSNYYKIVNAPLSLADLKSKYTFDTITAFINNSSISKVNREIQYSIKNKANKRAFITTERDTVTGEILEYETVELLENGLSRFALYDLEGNLKNAGDKRITEAGKPGKCMWCHETGIQPIFRKQINMKNHITTENFLDSLIRYNKELKNYQDRVWQDAFIKNRKLHTEMEIAYITFMEPSIEQLSNEWQITMPQVKKKVAHLKSHKHHEFNFLGELYHRKDVDNLSPFKVLRVPESIREELLTNTE